MSLSALATALLLLSGDLVTFEPIVPVHEPNAILINISEPDLNRIVRDAFREQLGTRIEGLSSDASRGVQDLRYAATFSEPNLELDTDGRLRVDLDLLQANVRIGRFERRFMRRMASCDGAGVNVDPDRPVEVAIHMSLAVDHNDLQIVPSSVTLGDPKNFRLVRPTKCRNTWLPKWLVWRLGKGQLRRKIKSLDDLLLVKAQRSADELSDENGLLTKQWRIGKRDVSLYPQEIDTSHGSLLIGFTGSTTGEPTTAGGLPEWVAQESHRSYLGLSESFLNSAARAAIERLRAQPRKPSGDLSKLFRGSAVHTLVPGLRDLPSTDELRLGMAFHRAPEIEFEAIGTARSRPPSSRAVIRIRLSRAELTIWNADEVLGTLKIESARLAVAPYLNVLGGISFEIIENSWLLSSRDLDFDEETLAAMFQELFFGEIFETHYQPLAQHAFDVGETRFHPRYFTLLGHYLVVGLSEFGPDAVSVSGGATASGLGVSQANK